jgi:hypothetical protein
MWTTLELGMLSNSLLGVGSSSAPSYIAQVPVWLLRLLSYLRGMPGQRLHDGWHLLKQEAKLRKMVHTLHLGERLLAQYQLKQVASMILGQDQHYILATYLLLLSTFLLAAEFLAVSVSKMPHNEGCTGYVTTMILLLSSIEAPLLDSS